MSQFRRNMLESQILKLFTQTLSKIRNNEIQGKLISFTSVKLSRDKSFVDISVSALNEDVDEIVKVLNKLKGLFRKDMSQKIKMYKVPEVRFFKDKGLEDSIKIQKLLNEIKVEGDTEE
ncbi:hypothetical protein OSSY52_11260 [Tepiditoga spiralis]|uniref:Ribosome-binding factor A n=1 Tax=Tepiditoga spiralis TaxID=2108365 RepID=A0A7G1G4G0_9BACT|nr:30S ribosome-binding factor RbfA [Tepiditoga spiralis]BBE30985.1 hypothetical protein OSSY52_11260 [Tepiditoga spiralis]